MTIVGLGLCHRQLVRVLNIWQTSSDLGFTNLTDVRHLFPSLLPEGILGESLILLGLLLPFPMALFFRYGWRRILGLVSGCAATVIMCCIFMTYERAAVLMAVVFVVSGILTHRAAASISPKDICTWMAPFLLAAIIVASLSAVSFSTALQLHLTESQKRSTSGRIHVWLVASHIIRDHPWLGVGPNSFARVYSQFEHGTPEQAIANRPFNLLLGAAAEYGVPFAVVLVVFLSLQLRSAHVVLIGKKLSGNDSALEICCVAAVYGVLAREVFYSSLFRSYETALLFMLVLAWTEPRCVESQERAGRGTSLLLPLSVTPVGLTVLLAALFFMYFEERADRHFAAGAEKVREADFISAMNEFKVGTEISPRNSYYHASYGLAAENQVPIDSWGDVYTMSQSGQFTPSPDLKLRDLAESEYRAALELNPNDPLFLNNLAWIEEAKGKWQVALRLVQQARTLSPATPLYQISASVLEELAGQRDDSLVLAATAIAQSPVLAYSSWFSSLRRQCRSCSDTVLTLAMKDILSEYRTDKSPLIAARLGALYFISGRSDDGYNLLRSAVTQMPNLPEAWCFMARYMMERANYLEANLDYSKALFLDPNSSTARLGLCQVAVREGGSSDLCEAPAQWRFGDGIRSPNSMRAQYLYGVADRDAIADDVLPRGFLSFCCFIAPNSGVASSSDTSR